MYIFRYRRLKKAHMARRKLLPARLSLIKIMRWYSFASSKRRKSDRLVQIPANHVSKILSFSPADEMYTENYSSK